MRTSIASIILTTAIFAACESSDIISLPHQEHRLVVNSIGYSNRSWSAMITLSQDVLYSDFRYKDIARAKVSIYENGVFAEQLRYKPSIDTAKYNGWYEGASIAKPGNVYKIIVEHPDYPSLESEYKQPDVVEIKSADIRVVGKKSGQFGNTQVSAVIGFDDPPGENFYEISVMANDTTRHPGSPVIGHYANTILTFVDPVYKQFDDVYFPVTAFDDTNFDGQSVKLEFTGAFYDSGYGVNTFTVYIRNLSKDYYEYMKAGMIQHKNADDPFAQPISTPNNIVNGYGLFAGFTESSITVGESEL